MRERLGKGGFGVVYRATMQSPGGLRSDVAVKLLHNPTEDSLRRLKKEAKLLAALSHPAILRVHDLVKLQGRVALVTEYVGGLDLADAFRLDPPLPPRALVQVVGQVAEAIHAAWNTTPPGGTAPLRLVHRDIKPANIRIGAHGEVKLLDFGIAFAEESDQSMAGETHGTSFLGSVPYMAPERFGRAQAVPEGDVYALGCTLFEGLTGQRLHVDVTLGEMARRSGVAETHDAFVEQAVDALEDIPDDLRALLRECLHHDDTQRPPPKAVFGRCEAIADEMSGPRLKVWCRELPAGDTIDGGPLSGRVLSEGTLALDSLTAGEASRSSDFGGLEATASYVFDEAGSETWGPGKFEEDPATEERVAPPSRRPWVFGGVAVGIVVLLAVGGGLWAASGGSSASVEPAVDELPAVGDGSVEGAAAAGPPEAVTPAADDATAEAPPDPAAAGQASEIEAPQPAPLVDPKPAATRPKPVATRPAPSEPKPEPVQVVKEPEPMVAATGTFAVSGEVTKVRLMGSGGTRFSPGAVPAGTYRVLAAFDGGELTDAQIRLDVPADGTLTVRCNPVQWTCERAR